MQTLSGQFVPLNTFLEASLLESHSSIENSLEHTLAYQE